MVSSHFEAKRKLLRCGRLFLLGIPARQSSMLSLWGCFFGDGGHVIYAEYVWMVCVFNLIGCVSVVREVRCMVGS